MCTAHCRAYIRSPLDLLPDMTNALDMTNIVQPILSNVNYQYSLDRADRVRCLFRRAHRQHVGR